MLCVRTGIGVDQDLGLVAGDGHEVAQVADLAANLDPVLKELLLRGVRSGGGSSELTARFVFDALPPDADALDGLLAAAASSCSCEW